MSKIIRAWYQPRQYRLTVRTGPGAQTFIAYFGYLRSAKRGLESRRPLYTSKCLLRLTERKSGKPILEGLGTKA
jgi:hypothetical protein